MLPLYFWLLTGAAPMAEGMMTRGGPRAVPTPQAVKDLIEQQLKDLERLPKLPETWPEVPKKPMKPMKP